MNDLGFEQTADRLGEFIVVGIAMDGGSFYDEVSAKTSKGRSPGAGCGSGQGARTRQIAP